MSAPIFPLAFASEEFRLLTAIGLGFLFGFALERGGFANARKLAAQFYLYDMTVFKVMFTAILVAMVGFYTLSGAGLVDAEVMWINPTFMWAQLVGGFMLGIGFVMSGLCPGTSAVSAASGRLDGLVTFAGIFVGVLVFAVVIEWVPALERLYETGGQVSIVPDLLGLPTPAVVFAVVLLAGAAFVGAEKVERIFQAKYGMIELTPQPTKRTPRVKFAVAGSLAAVVVVSLAWKAPGPDESPIPMQAIEPLALAEAIIASDPSLLILDLRTDRDSEARAIPGGYPADDSSAVSILQGANLRTTVIVYDEDGTSTRAPGHWPRNLTYHFVRGGRAAWQAEVLKPMESTGSTLAEQEFVRRQNQIAGYFSGAAVQSTVQAPPPIMPSGGGGSKKRAGGC